VVGLLSATRVRLIVLLAVAVFAAGLLFVSTSRWGLGVSYDSVVYVQASHHLGSIPLPQGADQGGKALYWWAPGYPIVLEAFGGDYSGARLLNTLLLFLGVLLVAGVAWKAVGPREGLVAGALYGLSPAVFSVHAAVLAEPLFLLLITAALWLIATGRSMSAGVAAGAATLTRYAGLPLVLVGGLMLHGRERRRSFSRLARSGSTERTTPERSGTASACLPRRCPTAGCTRPGPLRSRTSQAARHAGCRTRSTNTPVRAIRTSTPKSVA
jgi:hypothetical protein